MTDSTETLGEVTLKNVRLAFPDLFVPTAMQEGQTKQYGATLLFPKDGEAHKAVEAAIQDVAKAKWGKGAAAVLDRVDGDTQLMCLIDGDHKKKKHLDGYPGNMALSAKNKKRPTVVDVDATTLTADDDRPYAGCYVVAKVTIWAQNNQHGKAIRASLGGIQFYRDGDSFSAGSVAKAEDFTDLSAEVDEEVDDLL